MIKKFLLTSILSVLPLVSNAAMSFTGFYQSIDVSIWTPVILK